MSMATRRLNPKFLFSRFCVPRPIASLLLRFPDNTDPRKTRRNKHVSCSFTLWSEDANYKYKHHANTLNPTKHIKTKNVFLSFTLVGNTKYAYKYNGNTLILTTKNQVGTRYTKVGV